MFYTNKIVINLYTWYSLSNELLWKLHLKHYNKIKGQNTLNFVEKSPKLIKNLQICIKLKLTTWNLQFLSEWAQIQYNIIIKPHKQEKLQKNLLLKAAREQKNFARSEKNFSHITFSLSQNQRYEQKTILFSLRSSLLFSTQNHSKFFHAFHFPLQNSLQ